MHAHILYFMKTSHSLNKFLLGVTTLNIEFCYYSDTGQNCIKTETGANETDT